jgi:tetratricopeptide (TPR) repeat protein
MTWGEFMQSTCCARSSLRLVIVALATLGIVGVAAADDLQTCHDESGDVAIAGCTRAIESGRLTKKNMAVAFTSRGVEWRAKGDLDRAIRDHTEAIRVDPNGYLAFFNRGNAYLQKGDVDGALADYGAALRINSKDPVVFHNRGIAYQRKGDTVSANADFATEKTLRR